MAHTRIRRHRPGYSGPTETVFCSRGQLQLSRTVLRVVATVLQIEPL